MNEIKGHRKCTVVPKLLENIEGAVAPPPFPQKVTLMVFDINNLRSYTKNCDRGDAIVSSAAMRQFKVCC